MFKRGIEDLEEGVTVRFKSAIAELKGKALMHKGIIAQPKGKSLITKVDYDMDKLSRLENKKKSNPKKSSPQNTPSQNSPQKKSKKPVINTKKQGKKNTLKRKKKAGSK